MAEIDPLGDKLVKKAIETVSDSRATKTKSRYYLQAHWKIKNANGLLNALA